MFNFTTVVFDGTSPTFNTSVFAHYTSYVNTQRTLPTLLILALHGGEQSDSHTSCLTLREEPFL